MPLVTGSFCFGFAVRQLVISVDRPATLSVSPSYHLPLMLGAVEVGRLRPARQNAINSACFGFCHLTAISVLWPSLGTLGRHPTPALTMGRKKSRPWLATKHPIPSTQQLRGSASQQTLRAVDIFTLTTDPMARESPPLTRLVITSKLCSVNVPNSIHIRHHPTLLDALSQ